MSVGECVYGRIGGSWCNGVTQSSATIHKEVGGGAGVSDNTAYSGRNGHANLKHSQQNHFLPSTSHYHSHFLKSNQNSSLLNPLIALKIGF